MRYAVAVILAVLLGLRWNSNMGWCFIILGIVLILNIIHNEQSKKK